MAKQQLKDRILGRVLTHPRTTLAIVFAATVLSALLMIDVRTGQPRIDIDSSTDSMLPKHDEGRVYFERIKSLLDSGETTLVALSSDDVFTAESLQRIQAISERLEGLEQVERVSSLSTALNIRGEDGSLLIEPFFEDVPEDAAGLADLRRRALSDPIYAGNLVSKDGRVSVIAVTLLDLPEKEIQDSGIDERIQRIAKEEKGNLEVWVAGGAHVKAEMHRLMLRDLGVTTPLSVLVMSLVAFLSFRTVRGVLIPLLTAGISILITMSFVAVVFEQLNQITIAAPPIMLVVGFAYSIHVLSAYYDAIRLGSESSEHPTTPAEVAISEVATPVLFTGITTAAGFFSLMTSPLEAIVQFGAFCGVGVMVTVVVTLTFAPALLQVLAVPKKVSERKGKDVLDALFEDIARFDLQNGRGILIAGAIVAVVAFAGMFLIEVGTDMVSNFKRDNVVRSDFESVNDHLEGANAFNVIIETTAESAFKEPANLRVLEKLQAWLAEQPEIGGSTSLADYVKVIHQGLQDGSKEEWRIPDSRELVSQLLVVGANDEITTFVDFDYQVANVVVRTTAMDSAAIMRLVERIEVYLESVPSHLRTAVTGNTVLLGRTMDDIAVGQALSLGTAFVIIFAILSLMFMSVRSGFVALIPNVLPVLIYFGVLGWSGITLNTTTGLVACLVLGIAVDDTIHLMAHFNAASKRYADQTRGIVEAICVVGRPVTYTTVALCLGFSCLMLSSMKSQIEFGMLAAFTLAVAWVVDLTFTPALASRMRVVTIWDVLTLDLGEAPHLSIPLFRGLRPYQARIVALMTSVRSVDAAAQLFKTGDFGDRLYVVLDGELLATSNRDGREVPLVTMKRGDVVGEIAPYFQGRRTANVHATADTRLLGLTNENLERLCRRYPRIGARIYANLNEVIATRLVSMTSRVAA